MRNVLVVVGRQRPTTDPDNPGLVTLKRIVFVTDGPLSYADRMEVIAANVDRRFHLDDVRVEQDGREIVEFDNPQSYEIEAALGG